MSPGEDDKADAGACATSLPHSLDADKLHAQLLQATPPPDDSQEQSDHIAHSLLLQDGYVPCELDACLPYWNLLEGDYVGAYCAQQSLWQAFHRHQEVQRNQPTMQKLERAIRARRRQWTLPHVSVRLLPRVQRQCQWQTWVEFQDFLLQKHVENIATLETWAANNTVWSRGEVGRLTVMNRCFATNVLPWTEKVRLDLTAAPSLKAGEMVKALRAVSNRLVARRTKNRISKPRSAPSKTLQRVMIRQTRQTTERRVQRQRASADK